MNAFPPQLSSAYATPMGMGMVTPAPPQHPTTATLATDFLPSISPSVMYSTAHAVWSPQELQVFHKGLADFPADQYDNVTRYLKIAAMLPGKCARDVACKVKALSVAQESMSMSRDQYAKRMKIAPYQPHDGASKFAFSMPASSNVFAFDDPEDAHLNALLQDNMLLMNTMRSNLLSGKLDDNKDPMSKFRDNCNTVLTTLGDICNAIPPLPVKLDTSLLHDDSSSDPHIV